MFLIWETQVFLKYKSNVVLLIKTRDTQMYQPPTEHSMTGPATSTEINQKWDVEQKVCTPPGGITVPTSPSHAQQSESGLKSLKDYTPLLPAKNTKLLAIQIV